MCEVNVRNFKKLFPEIKKHFQEAKFISLDLEFSALNPLSEYSPSLFDTPSERYYKLKKNLETVIPVQIGLTAFTFDSNRNSYCGKVYTFYVQPACFQYVNRNFYFQSNTLHFLKLYNFDFNKFAYDGIPFINRQQEQDLREKLKNNELSEVNASCRTEIETIIEKEGKIIEAWYSKAKIGEFLVIPKICTDRHNNNETLYFLHKAFRNKFKHLWTSVENNEFIVKKVSKEDFNILNVTQQLEEETINDLLGFTKCFRLITALQKPIVGHNLFQDLLLLISSFETTLPESYVEFKKLVNDLLPVIFDTRNLSYEMRDIVPSEKKWNDRGLDTIFDYFKNGIGRHLATNSPAIEMENEQDSYGKFHDGGWDSFCAGYVFIRLAHLNIYGKYPTSKRFVSSEHIGGLLPYKNRVNLIRCSVSYIFAYDGIPFINRQQEQDLREKLKNNELSEVNASCRTEIETIIEKEGKIIEAWYSKAKIGEFLVIPKICTDRHNNNETLYFLHKAFRNKFKHLWTSVENNEFIVKKVSKEDFNILNVTQQLEEETINDLLGFTKCFRLITALQKPIVGHNLFQDLLLLISSFETTLPESYVEFKKLVNDLLPVIFDTRNLSYEMRDIVPSEKKWNDRGLDTIFDYFKNGIGRHLATNSPAIEMENEQDSYGKFHDGGWDSFCAGYVFIRLAHLNIYGKYPTSKRFVSSEHIGGLLPYKNRVNLIRCSVSYINLDGPDPNSNRPPYLVIESIKNKPVSIPQVISLLSHFGFVEVRKFPYERTKALIAVDNYGNARRILKDFKNNQNFRIRQYDVLRHSPVVKACLLGGLTVSSLLLIWLTHSVIRR